MRNVHRYYVPGALVFVTCVTHGRRPIFAQQQSRDLLFDTMRRVQALHPFQLLAYVVLPDHLHWLMRTPAPVTFSEVMHSIKRNFAVNVQGAGGDPSVQPVWQPRFWDHVIRDEADLAHHCDYIHYNAVKHGLCERPEDWPFSTYGFWLDRGAYEVGWGWAEPAGLEDIGSE